MGDIQRRIAAGAEIREMTSLLKERDRIATRLAALGAGDLEKRDVRVLRQRLAVAVDALRPFVAAFDAVRREFCPGFDGLLDLEAFNRAAHVLDAMSEEER